MELKLNQRLSNLKLREKVKKLKIKEKINILKEDIRARPLNYVIPIIFIVILDYPLTSYAEYIGKDTCPNPSPPKSNLDKYRELGLSVLGLKKCLDPCVTPFQNVWYCTRPCCIIAGLTAGCIAEKSPIGTPLHKAASVCCASSWATYVVLINLDPKKTLISKK